MAINREVLTTRLVRLDAGRHPRQIDLALDPGDLIGLRHVRRDGSAVSPASGWVIESSVPERQVLKGVYKLFVNKLTYCLSAPGETRPEGFAVLKGSGQTLVHLERFFTGEAKIEAVLKDRNADLRMDEIGWITHITWRDRTVTDDDLNILTGLSNLESLYLEDASITDAGLVHLKNFKALRNLNLSRTQITDNGLKHLSGSPELQSLILNGTQVTDAGLVHIRGFDKFYNLHLAQTRVTDGGLAMLEDLPALHNLNLEGTSVTDAGLVHLIRFPELNDLRLSGTQVTDKGRSMLVSALPEVSFDR